VAQLPTKRTLCFGLKTADEAGNWSALSNVVPPGLQSPTHRVKADGTGDFATIQEAIHAAADGDTIELADGTYRGEGNRDIDFTGKAIVVRSEGRHPISCVIDCEGSSSDPHRGFHFHSQEGPGSWLEGLTITRAYIEGNWPEGGGGGILCANASPTIADVVLSGNSATQGAGLCCYNGASPVLTDVTFAGNAAVYSGGGVYCSFSSPTFTQVDFSGNSAADYGGGMSGYQSSVTLTHVTFTANSAAYGGGLDLNTSSSNLTDVTFFQNVAGLSGGGLHSWGISSPTLTDVVFQENSSVAPGGGMACASPSHPTVTDVTFWGNSSQMSGGALAMWSTGDFSSVLFRANSAGETGGALYCSYRSSPELANVTFYGNDAPLGGALSCDWGGSVSLANSIISFSTTGEAAYCDHSRGTCSASLTCCDLYGNAGGDWVGCVAGEDAANGNISQDPLFCNPASGNFYLQASSPCAPFSAPNDGCDLIGARPVGCF